MYERLLDKNEIPTTEAFLEYIGERMELFKNIDDFLINEIISNKIIKFDAHSRCWKMNYFKKKEYICDIIAEKDAFTIVTRLSNENIDKIYGDLSSYAKECIDNSPFRQRGWIEYRVLSFEQLESVKILLNVRTSSA